MKQYKFDVVIIGAGPAGVTAAGALAGTGISVALLEAGVYAGAENWSGCVYFTENLAEKDCFGPEAVADAPYERRVHRRGTLMHNGLDVVGVELTNPDIFKDCYTVLRPVYDPYFAHLARSKGAFHLTETTVTSLIRKDDRVIGVQTNRGPLYAEVVFIAEGDASHLVRSEKLERVSQPHYLQGVKAVLSLKPGEIEKRFKLNAGEGAAYELLVRNASIAGRTAKLNVGGFLYTNQDSLSLGYVLPLDNMRNNYRGSHDNLFEWMRSLPYIQGLTEGAALSAYGAKIIRSGGWKERPVLVEDGLAVGGASAGLGVDLPFPNFTGPASATGLYFARSVKSILKKGKPFSARNLASEYLEPLSASVYGKDARHLAAWPGYFGGSKVLFSRTVDLACGSIHFLSTSGLIETGRFLRSHILSSRGLGENVGDAVRAIGSLRLWKPVLKTLISPVTLWHWCLNLVKARPPRDPRLGIILHVNGKDVDAAALPWPVGALITRTSPALLRALEEVYANNGRPVRKKFSAAARHLFRGIKLSDLVFLPAFAVVLALIAFCTAVWDAFRFYALKTPVEKLLAEPVMAYNESQKRARDLDAVKPHVSLDAKLATNSYRVGSASHIRTLWPEALASHPDMSQAGLWWVCPARVYLYDAPLFGRGKVTVNFENCIKCEFCWRAEPGRVLWGRHTDHKLIYRPESDAISRLLEFLRAEPKEEKARQRLPQPVDEKLWYPSDELIRAGRAALSASAAFRDSIAALPASVDAGRKEWPFRLGKRLGEKNSTLTAALSNDGRYALARIIETEQKAIELCLAEGRLFHALYACRGLEHGIRSWTGDRAATDHQGPASVERTKNSDHAYDEISRIFPDRIVKLWEEELLPDEWAGKLRSFVAEHKDDSKSCVRALSSVSPALGLIAAHQLAAIDVLAKSGITLGPGICAVSGVHLQIRESIDAVAITGMLNLVPTAASDTFLILANGRGHLVPLATPGVSVTATPAIGFRAAGLATLTLDCTVKKLAILGSGTETVPDPAWYLAIALGAGDYLCRRAKEHAAGRVQFPGQMLDTEGRDGIAKLGAVKALIARVEAWRLLLETLYEADVRTSLSTRPVPSDHEPAPAFMSGTANAGRASRECRVRSAPEFDLLCASLAAMAFGPEPGAMGYDAGQVFGGFAYSEDDLLSRSYRDSSLFRFLAPGCGASGQLHAALGGKDLDKVFLEFGSLSSYRGAPLDQTAKGFLDIGNACMAFSSQVDPSLAGEAGALALGARFLLSGIEKGLSHGNSMETEAALAEVVLGLAKEAVARAEASSGRGRVSPSAVFPVEPTGSAATLDLDYDSFCAMPGEPHQSGGFLAATFDRSTRFVPEMQLHDAKLRTRWTELVNWFKKNCSTKTFDGLHIERFIEKTHRLPDEVLRAVKENKWLATTVPQSEDGLGWHKAEYYILNSAAGSYGDSGINLLIMASTSIGTTPIIQGLDEELPRVREELAPLAEDKTRLGEIGSRLEKIIETLSNPNPAFIKKEYEAVMKLVDGRIRRTRVVKYLAANFLRSFYGAGIAGRRGDFGGFTTNLRHAGGLFAKLMPDVRAALDELPRRERCHRLFLRYLGHSGVSAFALTEPTAGSDSGGIKTTAKLQMVKLTQLDDGRYSFYPNNSAGEQIRYLIDADRIVFIDRGIAYRTPDDASAAISFDKYDYASDQGVRTYAYKGQVCAFHDIGQVRQSDTGPMYEFYSVTGAKMWITNGSIATQFCLYAQTPEGVTGFMVDRHAEGLKVGADEKKTGQRGSPTNEISLDSVRVPREAVIGYEGHGQVNALETLNVGRCGLAVVSGALIRKLMHEAVSVIPASVERDKLLGEAAAIQFGSESLAYYLVGLFDRPHQSVRMESAIAKYVCSEDIHEVISLVERAYGPEGQTEKYLLEKARRDSRILTIYEGTNEVQRFLVLKDLIAYAVAWPELPGGQGDHSAGTLAEWKNSLRLKVKEAAALLGDTCWSDAMLQPALFPLAEMAGEILRLECIYYRREWLGQKKEQLGPGYTDPLLEAGARAAEKALQRLKHLDRKFSIMWEQVKKNITMPEVRAADAALDRMMHKSVPDLQEQMPLQAPLRMLSIVKPVADLSPSPRLSGGSIEELVWKLDPLDRAGLAQALELKSRNSSQITLDVLMAGPSRHEHLLREYAGAAADRIIRLNVEHATPIMLAEAIRTLELLNKQYDLIILGSVCLNGDAGVGACLAGSLRRPVYQRKRIVLRPDGMGLERVAPPAVACITETVSGPAMDMATAVASASLPVLTLEPSAPAASVALRFETPAAASTTTKLISSVSDAADLLKAYAAAASSSRADEYAGEAGRGRLADGDAVWAVLDPREQKSNLSVLRASRQLADASGRQVRAIVPAPKDTWPQLLGLARENGAHQAFCMDTGGGMLSIEGKREALRRILKASATPLAVAGTYWTEAFGFLSGEASVSGKRIQLFDGVSGIVEQAPNDLLLSLSAYDSRLIRREPLVKGAAFMTVLQEAEFPAASALTTFTASSLDLALDAEWIMPLPPVSGPSLSQAEVIIDLGYGLKDRTGLELAGDLKKKLETMGLAPLFGATRKVTQDLKLLPLDAQIGQTGVRVNPKLIIAIGISGAPQHIDYIGTRAEILCFNKDADAPLMKLNQARHSPRVHPIAGDLFLTVRELIDKLG